MRNSGLSRGPSLCTLSCPEYKPQTPVLYQMCILMALENYLATSHLYPLWLQTLEVPVLTCDPGAEGGGGVCSEGATHPQAALLRPHSVFRGQFHPDRCSILLGSRPGLPGVGVAQCPLAWHCGGGRAGRSGGPHDPPPRQFVLAALVLSLLLPKTSQYIKWIVAAGLAQVSEFALVLGSRARRARVISREVSLPPGWGSGKYLSCYCLR